MRFQLFFSIIIFSNYNSSTQTLESEKINLSDRRLVSVPDSIFDHKHLISLDLSSSMTIYPPLSALLAEDANRISAIPTEIEKLKLLRSINLSGNLIKTFPASMRKMVNLDSLDISYNQDMNLLTELTTTLKSLEKLTYLNVTGVLYDPEDIDSLKHALGPRVKIVESPH